MISYYTSIILLCLMSLFIMCVLVHENNRINKSSKRLFYLTYVLIAASAVSEWLGIQMNGVPEVHGWAIIAVKCSDYILTPLAGGTLVAQMRQRNIWSRILMYVLAANVLFQLAACFNGWMVVLSPDNKYSHGPLYAVYIGVYLIVIFLTIIEFFIYGRTFRKTNRASLYSILGLIIAGIGMQEVFGSECRTAYITLTLTAALMFIHNSEFTQLAADEHLSSQQRKLSTDALTGALSRYAYIESLSEFDGADKTPEELTAFMIDVNGLKTVNDRFGHEAGDEIILGAAECISGVFAGQKAKCFRTGGDEFVVLAEMSGETAEKMLAGLEKEALAWSEEREYKLSLSAGYARIADHAGMSCENLVSEADRKMYEAKQEYYKKAGIRR